MARNVGYMSLTTQQAELQAEDVHQRRVVFVIFDGFQPLDLVGPHEVFQQAGRISRDYDCQVVAPVAGPVRSGSGLEVQASHGVGDLDPGGIDTLVVTGGEGVDEARSDPAWSAGSQPQVPPPAVSRRYAAACSCSPLPDWPAAAA
jgi:putative intracellular protease/amidase